MKSVVLIILTSISLISLGQETKKIKLKKSSNEQEVFYALKENENVKHGQYELYFNKWLKLSGYYSNNLKDSIWTEYTYTGNKIWEGRYKGGAKNGIWTTFSHTGKIESKGKYENDMRIGVWEFYNIKGELVQKFDFENKEIIYNDTSKMTSMFPIHGGIYDGLIYVDSLPTYASGETDFFQFLAKNLQYPSKAIEENISGLVLISVFVSENGELSDFEVYRGIGGGCDEEAIRVLKMTDKKWKAALFNGKSVATRIIVPFMFRLN